MPIDHFNNGGYG